MKKGILFCLFAACIFSLAQLACGQSVSITKITPSSPSTLNFGESVTVNFDYSINLSSGVRIFIRPFTAGQRTPNYSASGSPNYTNREGSGSARFTIREGTVVNVDQLRIQVVGTRRSRVLFEFFMPVAFTFGQKLTYTPIIPEYTIPKQDLKVNPNNITQTIPSDTTEKTVEKKTVKPDGTIEIHFSDGSIEGIITPNDRYYIDPETGDTLRIKPMFMFSDVQGAHEPADPPGISANTATNVNQEWLESLNAWIDYFGYQLLTKIENSLEKEAFENYQQFEANNSSNIYQQVNLRYTFLEKLRLSDM